MAQSESNIKWNDYIFLHELIIQTRLSTVIIKTNLLFYLGPNLEMNTTSKGQLNGQEKNMAILIYWNFDIFRRNTWCIVKHAVFQLGY